MDNDGNNIDAAFSGMSRYYDNRDAVVTATADDWAGWVNDKFVQTCRNFRSYNLWLSCAIVTDVGDPNTWIDIQTQLDSGYVEAISHSRTHPYTPYDDLGEKYWEASKTLSTIWIFQRIIVLGIMSISTPGLHLMVSIMMPLTPW